MLILSRIRNHLVGTLEGVPSTLFSAYVDFHKAFDWVHRELIVLRGMPEKILALVRAFYADTGSVVRYGRGTSKFFPVTTRVRQGCVLAPSLFSVYMDWIMGRTISSPRGSFDDERFTSQAEQLWCEL